MQSGALLSEDKHTSSSLVEGLSRGQMIINESLVRNREKTDWIEQLPRDEDPGSSRGPV